jgi:beta-lactamase class A
MVFAAAEIEAGRLGNSREVRQALAAMIASSSNDATSHIVDILTDTTSGPALEPTAFARWLHRREAINRFFARWRWPELAGSNLTQKTWYEAPYGRERQSRHEVKDNGNRLSSDGVARLLLAVERGEAVSRRRSRAMLRLMARFPERIDPKNPWDQMTGFLGEGLPPGARLWSKAGWSSKTRHDAAIVELAGGQRFILAVMTFGKPLAANQRLLPFIAREVTRGVGRL